MNAGSVGALLLLIAILGIAMAQAGFLAHIRRSWQTLSTVIHNSPPLYLLSCGGVGLLVCWMSWLWAGGLF